MADIEIARIRASNLADWLDCPLRMARETENRPAGLTARPDAIDVGQFVGTAVHEAVSTGRWTRPDRPVRYDRYTRSEQEMYRAIGQLTFAVNQCLDAAGATARDWERDIDTTISLPDGAGRLDVVGRTDLICQFDGVMALIDLKTGLRPPRAEFLQVGVYAVLLSRSADIDVERVGILHAPRHFREPARLIMRPAEPFVDAAADALRQMIRGVMQMPGRLRANPKSQSCHRCQVDDCPYQDLVQPSSD